MRRALLSLFVIIILVALFAYPTVIAASEDSEPCYGYTFMNQFVTLFPSRDAGSDEERAAALFIAEEFSNIGLTPYAPESETPYIQDFNFEGINSQNVIGKIDNPDTNKNIIISAHYDALKNLYGLQGGDGAYDNGSGVGSLVQSARALITAVNLTTDVTFVAFGAEEKGMYGSQYMVSKMSQLEITDTVLMISIDCISAGDYLYFYTGERENPMNDYIMDFSQSLNVDLKAYPYDKHATFITTSEASGLDYSHVALLSDNAPFMAAGINVVLFFGYNMESKILPPSESLVNSDIAHSTGDTLENVESLYGYEQVNGRIDGVAKLVTAIASTSDTVSVSEAIESDNLLYSFLASYEIMSYVNLGIKTVIIAGILLVIYKYRKKDHTLPPEPEIIDNKEELRYIFEDLKI